MADRSPLLDVRGLSVAFNSHGRYLPAVDRVTFEVGHGEVLGIVGESGSGKTATSMSLLRLLDPSGALISGEVRFEGRDLLAMPERELNGIRGRSISMIFQEPMSSLNPVLSVGEQIAEPLRFHLGLSHSQARQRAKDLLERVRIPAAQNRLASYPHELSGGLRQRVMIAIALSCNPKLLIADEPTTALDVTVQAQILDLLYELKSESGLSIIIITHDLGVIANFADRVAVMYCGRIMERGSVSAFFSQPSHPYTEALIGSIPDENSDERLGTIEGTVPKLGELPPGCRFAPRCNYSRPECDATVPELRSVGVLQETACIRPFGYRNTDDGHISS